MRFAKLHGLGNDFVLLDLRGRAGAAPPSPQRATELCDRHRGIGADGVLTLLDGDRFVIHNADGSAPEMCGNGARCAALWIATGGGARPARARVVLQTDAGPRPCAVEAESGSFGQVEVEMGEAEVGAPRELPGGFTAVRRPRRAIRTAWSSPKASFASWPRATGRRSAARRMRTSSSSLASGRRATPRSSGSAARDSPRPAARAPAQWPRRPWPGETWIRPRR